MKIHHLKKQLKKGFTLIEMLVVLAIIMLITVLVLANNGKLNSAVLVSNTAYEVGLLVREAQIAGLGVRATKDQSGSVVFTSSHGIYASMANPTKIVMFADGGVPQDGIYNPAQGELYQEYEFQKKAGTIISMCAKKDLGATVTTCSPGSPASITGLNVVFTRPNPEAKFKIQRVTNGGFADYSGGIVINIGFPGDICRSISIEKTGSVQIDTSYCPPII
jgi:prepilin-type N-terminal cleavage/methylation domain-containing protein